LLGLANTANTAADDALIQRASKKHSRRLALANEEGADQAVFKASDMQDYCDTIDRMARTAGRAR
jgi:hypothetical protein